MDGVKRNIVELSLLSPFVLTFQIRRIQRVHSATRLPGQDHRHKRDKQQRDLQSVSSVQKVHGGSVGNGDGHSRELSRGDDGERVAGSAARRRAGHQRTNLPRGLVSRDHAPFRL